MNLNCINLIDPSSRELLEAAGYADVESIAHADPAVMHRELAKANGLLHLSREQVSSAQIADWMDFARDLLAPPQVQAGDAGEELPPGVPPVNYERSPEVLAMLAGSPFALPLPARVLMENQVSVSQIPAGVMLNRYVGDLDVRVNQSAPPAPAAGSAGYTSRIAGSADAPGVDASRLGSARGQAQAQKPVALSRQDLIRSPRPSTNKGRSPESRWYIRGVLHDSPLALCFGALITMCVAVLLPASVVSATLLIFSSEMPESFSWVPGWLLAIPVSLPIFGIAYLIWGVGGKCRICNQKLFVHRSHLKNSKAHHVKGIGHIVPMCFHLLVFRWFRCTHCGTPVRVKE